MKEKMYVFEDLGSGERAIFSNEEELNTFLKEYGNHFFDDYNEWPEASSDYVITYAYVNPTYDEWNNYDV